MLKTSWPNSGAFPKEKKNVVSSDQILGTGFEWELFSNSSFRTTFTVPTRPLIFFWQVTFWPTQKCFWFPPKSIKKKIQISFKSNINQLIFLYSSFTHWPMHGWKNTKSCNLNHIQIQNVLMLSKINHLFINKRPWITQGSQYLF